ncbi:MAG: LPS export ABC transporter periplasmic protein LptC [Burkholderiaceae bacterium]|nr:LPS export ABC transporter periplasmic protein LptC [Burkholderiaceae bacterium]
MNEARAANRLRLLAILAATAAMALGSFWLRDVMLRGADHGNDRTQRLDPDYYVENFNFVRASKVGQARYAISGTKLTHFPGDDSYQIDMPVIRSLSVDRPSMVARALRAVANSDASKVEMEDDVRIDRPESKLAPAFHLKSQYVQLLPDDEVMQTDRAVDIVQGNAEISGAGMYANNATLVFSLAHNVHTVIQPR